MDTPLGRTAGHALEVRESVEVLAGGGPADVVMLARKMLPRRSWTLARTRPTPSRRHRDGRVAARMIAAQSGDPDAPLPAAPETQAAPAPATGVSRRLAAYGVGVASHS
jgi:thymidine phosphorylase